MSKTTASILKFCTLNNFMVLNDGAALYGKNFKNVRHWDYNVLKELYDVLSLLE
jgi:hypothetical protein